MSRAQVISTLQALFHAGTQEAEALFERLPTFQAIPAYIVGFVDSQDAYPALSYTGKKGKKHFMIQTWGGPLQPGDLEKIAAIEGITGQVKFEGIGEFSHSNAYLFNCGQLRWQAQDWQKHVIERL